MKNKIHLLAMTPLLFVGCLAAQGQGTAFTYQGRLSDGSNVASGTYDLRFAIYDSPTAGAQKGIIITNTALAVSNGFFTATLDFGNQFPGASRWLEIGVRTNGGSSFFPLSPRQSLTPAPYAITAGSVISGGLSSGTYGNVITLNNAANSITGTFSGNGVNVTNVNATTLNGATSAGFWKTNGNVGANPTNGAFMGTADNLPLEFRINNQRALRLQPGSDPVYGGDAPTLIGGSSGNFQSNGIYGAVISGGGNPSLPNIVGGNYSVVPGGLGNVASGNYSLALGFYNRASGDAAVAMGGSTVASGSTSTAMGNGTVASGDDATAMGEATTASAPYSVAMGNQSTASGLTAMAMGDNVTAAGFASFAAGRQAKAMTQGSFVWADSQGIDFSSIANDQFLIRAVGGVGIGTNYPRAALHVVGNIIASGTITGGFAGNGASVTNVNATTLSGVSGAGFWKTGGNTGADPASGAFIGNSDNLPLEFRVNNARALRLEYAYDSLEVSIVPNLIGGYSGNFVSNGVVGAFIGSGGNVYAPNIVGGPYASVLGGVGNSAGGRYSTAMGRFSQASGFGAVAFGDSVVASGFDSVALGSGTVASGGGSVALGGSLDIFERSTTASGSVAVALGDATLASGANSTAMGYRGTASGNAATAMGNGSTASGANSTAAGLNNVASGINSVAMGESCIASNLAAIALGYHTIAGGPGSSALGVFSQALHNNTFAWSDGSPTPPFASSAANQFLIYASSGVGIGTNNPQGSLHVASANGYTAPQVAISQLNTNDHARLQMGVAGFPQWTVVVQPSVTPELLFWNGSANVAYLTYGGALFAQSFNPISDRNVKENFQSVSARAVLEKVAALPISQWNFKTAPGEEHIGPMAQDFYAAFGTGADDKHIATVDADGVALAAIQGLNEKLAGELQQKETEITELKQRLAALEKIVLNQTPY